MSTPFSGLFSRGKHPKKPIGDQPCVTFDVVKTNRYGKRQKRNLCFAADGVRNMDGTNVKWFIGKDEILGFHRDAPGKLSFTLTTIQRVHFDSQDENQLEKIFETINKFDIGSEEMSKMISEKAPGQGFDDDDDNVFEYNAFDETENRLIQDSSNGSHQINIPSSQQTHQIALSAGSAKSAGVVPPPPLSLPLNNMQQFGLSSGTGPTPTMPNTRPFPFGGKAPGSGKTGGLVPLSVMSSYMLIPPNDASSSDGSAEGSSSAVASSSTSPQQVMPPSLPPPRPDVPLGFSITPSANTVSLANFDILAVVGMGSFGKVFQVRYKHTGQIFAMKTLQKKKMKERKQEQHTLTERTILALFSSPRNESEEDEEGELDVGSAEENSKRTECDSQKGDKEERKEDGTSNQCDAKDGEDSGKNHSEKAGENEKASNSENAEEKEENKEAAGKSQSDVSNSSHQTHKEHTPNALDEDLLRTDIIFPKLTKFSSLPFIPKLHFAFQTPRKLYVVMDWANGGELFFHLRRAGTFPLSLSLFYVAELALTLHHLHSQKIVYRDLKPENVLIQENGHIMLTDFGLAKMGISGVGGGSSGGEKESKREKEKIKDKDKANAAAKEKKMQTYSGPGIMKGMRSIEEKENCTDTDLIPTLTSTFCGTPEYLAPEVIQGLPYGTAVDWWALGVLFFEMLFGHPPFYSSNRNQLYWNTLNSSLTFPSSIPSVVQDFITALLSRNPLTRLGSGPQRGLEVLSHPVFAGIDWNKLKKLLIAPPFKPSLKLGVMDMSNIDTAFLSEPPVDSPGPEFDSETEAEEVEREFEGFDYNEEMVQTEWERELKEKRETRRKERAMERSEWEKKKKEQQLEDHTDQK
ncbi:putative Protein kinase domain [Monocercomonoides exilis]|uniref:putative Protein kinase domain n=1 Tax=Monocercomonoides exilis TaxID=2049356 RepID=UPI00355A8B4D|nr:putative Protein kinase domain [Monocercomonoides exilis]|eukprot:MONOS_1603.1-p1 / transcript=MONOS_1603.1 / gene=MONOS_1603 / organism=Monocercomonoides_exilis_PA203 / gene_product=Protein kinase domain / transcript_product=Protein kinase domain / location=Mono_scaffold00029:39492-42779(-) / protein_length=861 / sequence_SO=supercontig / SO=protein_coding / is_pseudo=false